MVINEDADGATIAKETIAAVNECARMIGKIGPKFTAKELADMEEAIGRINNAIEFKKRMTDANRT